jgi:ribosome-associated protein
MKKRKEITEEELLKVIIESIINKKGKEIVSIDLSKVDNSICDYFVICHGDSTTQVDAIAEEVRHKTHELLNVKVGHIEGQQNSQWILMDYFNIVVHIFLLEQRNFYHLEELWADGKTVRHNEN